MAPKRRRKRARAVFPCPNCGTDVQAGAPACRECGSDAETGWSDETLYDDLDLPEPLEDVEYSEERPLRKGPLLVVIILIALIVYAIA